MSMKTRLLKHMLRKKLDEHSEEIKAEMDRIRGFSSPREALSYGKEKFSQAAQVARERGPDALRLAKEEWRRMAGKFKEQKDKE